jgi:7-cyano-7-deazaguanine reductase
MPEPDTKSPERRNLISAHANTSLALDYVTTFSGQISHSNGPDIATIKVDVRYVPDKLVMDMNSLPDYLQRLNDLAQHPLEKLAGVILEDLNNELVPRWLHVTAAVGDTANPVRHSVAFEDRQPNWDNPALLARLASI